MVTTFSRISNFSRISPISSVISSLCLRHGGSLCKKDFLYQGAFFVVVDGDCQVIILRHTGPPVSGLCYIPHFCSSFFTFSVSTLYHAGSNALESMSLLGDLYLRFNVFIISQGLTSEHIKINNSKLVILLAVKPEYII